ncbi:MAG: hypothetical protein ACLFS7_10215, partial [Desulfosudaceae bacterium]
MTMNIVSRIDPLVTIKNVLVSVSDKRGLADFIPRLLEASPRAHFYSTGGTFTAISQALGDQTDKRLTPVSEYTGQPETQGGLVKTLDFKIYLGLLTETYNEAHAEDMARTGAVPIDLVVVNLYPFVRTIAGPEVTPEQARGNIDIGGPCMLRAAAKNFIRVAPVVDPGDYDRILREMEQNQGALSLETRFDLAGKAFEHTAGYDRAIADYLAGTDIEQIKSCYN